MQVNNREIAVDDFGDGPVMLCVHGLGGTSNFWRPVVTQFASRFRVIAVDLPSAGRSENDSSLSVYSLASDLLALMDQMEIETFHLVGHSMGTIVCQHMAVAAPTRVLDMVLLGPLAEPPEAARGAIAQRADVARSDGMEGIANTIADVALSTETKSDNPNGQGFVREMLMRQSAEGYALSCIALSQAKAAAAETINCNVALITGDQDAVAPEANVSVLREAISGSEMHVLSGCGHWTLTERAPEVLELMDRFYGDAA